MTLRPEDRNQFVNEVGYEAFEHIVKRMEALGTIPVAELLPLVFGAVNVCLANAMRSTIERASDPAAAAEALLAASQQQTRMLLDQIIQAPRS
ncbi:Uncharacterised protein [Xylophilus ampelinus]|nr:hypothetical protein [Variovorax sp.]VTY36767.1 Uncharacterised protein [Xylophilus ampelinus]